MKSFQSIEKLDTGILYILELASSLSVLLLAFGLIASMANVLTKGSVLTDNLFMQRVWAWTQCIAIDASVAGTIMRAFYYRQEGEKVKTWLYGLLPALLLFTAAIVSNIESVQQTLNVALDAAYVHVFIPVEALIWVRSLAIVLLLVAHAMRHVGKQPEAPALAQPSLSDETMNLILARLEKLDALEQALTAQTVVSEQQEALIALPAPEGEQGANIAPEADQALSPEQATNNFERVQAYLGENPDAKVRDVAEALAISSSTANKWMNKNRKCMH